VRVVSRYHIGDSRHAAGVAEWYDWGNKSAPRRRANAVTPRGLADCIGVDW
jgi:hypothetical protein